MDGLPGAVGIHCDEMIPPEEVVVQTPKGGKIVAQLMHAGWFGSPDLRGCLNVGLQQY